MRGLLGIAILSVTAAACFGTTSTSPTTGTSTQGSSQHTIPVANLTLVVTVIPDCRPLTGNAPCRSHTHRYSLRCDPARGTMPDPEAACTALGNLLDHPPNAHGCPFGPAGGGGARATIAGTVTSRPFHLELVSNTNWCYQPKNVTRDYWILSTFPCSTFVLHTGGTRWHTKRAWAEHNGCLVEAR